MKKVCRICLLLLVVIMITGMTVPALAANTGASFNQVSSGCVTLDAKAPLSGSEKLLDTAKSAILYELESNTLVYAWNPDAQVDPSGMNKIMTALIALEQGNPDVVVTVTRSALNSVAIGSVSAGLKRGEEITLRDLLYCMMVGSANDAAAVIAEFIGTTQEQFVDMMNSRAKELGCENTHFLNPNGLSQDGQYSTARDLAKITLAALEYELFAQMFSAVSYTVPATNKVEERNIVTTNHLMSTETVKNQYDSRVTGGKTGALSTTDRSLICTAEYGGKRYLTVVMSAQGTVTANGLSVKTFGSFEETRVLLDYGFNQYTVRQVLQEGQTLEQFAVSGGENKMAVGPARTLTVTLPVGVLPEEVTYRCDLNSDQIHAPIEKGQIIGSAEVWYRGICIGQSDLIAMHDVREAGTHMSAMMPSAELPMDQEIRDWLIIGGAVVLGVAVVAGIVLLVMRLIRKRQLDRRHKLINEGRQ